MARTVSDNDVELFNNNIKADFDLTAEALILKGYLANDIFIANISNIFASQKIEKILFNFNETDTYNTIAHAIQDASSISQETLQAYYANLLSQQQSTLKTTIYTQIDSHVVNIKERIKNRIPTPTANDILSNMTPAETRAYNEFIEYFLNQYIYNVFDNPNNPLKSINTSYETYLTSRTIDQRIATYQRYYAALLNSIKSKIDMRLPEYKDSNAVRKRIAKLNLNINSFIIPFIDMILQSSSVPNKCFIQNYGNIDVNMRPCSVYFVKERQMCDKFEEIYRMSNLQLQTLLYLHGPNWGIYNKPDNTTFNIYIYNKNFIDIINRAEKQQIFDGSVAKYDENNAHIKGIFNDFRVQLSSIYQTNRITEQIDSLYSTELIKKIIKDIYTNTLQYNNKTYNYLALHRIRQQKLNNNGKQLCKIQIPDMVEIGSENTYKYRYENKVQGTQGHQHINPPELWGSCFYNLQSSQQDDASRQRIQETMKSKYNISPSCDNHVIENLKCKTGCSANNNDKFMAFDASTFAYNSASMKLNEGITISSDIVFLKIKHNIRFFGTAGPVSVNFVRFNNMTKRFDNIPDIISLNPMIKEKLFNIKTVRYRISLEPNTSKKNVYICNFYNGILYEYSTYEIDTFSLNELSGQSLKTDLPDTYLYSQVSLGILLLSHISSMYPFSKKCIENSTYGSNFIDTKNCMNEIKNLINNIRLAELQNTLKQYQDEKSYFEQLVGNFHQQVIYKEQELQNSCATPEINQQRSIYEINISLQNTMIKIIDEKRKELRNELENWENWKPDWWKPWEWIHKVKMTNDTKRYIWEKDKEWGENVDKLNQYKRGLAVISDKCNRIEGELKIQQNNKKQNEEIIVNRINPKVQGAEENIGRYNRKDPAFFYQDIETYHINQIDVASKIVSLNNKLLFDFFWKYIVIRYNNRFLTSNDDCIYIQVN